MAYNKKKIFDKAITIAKEGKCYFIEQLVSKLPCSKPTFYELFPIDSNELNDIKELINKNKESKKEKMYEKWFESENPTLQVGLMKLLSTDEQAHRLNGTSQKVEHSGAVDIKPKQWVKSK